MVGYSFKWLVVFVFCGDFVLFCVYSLPGGGDVFCFVFFSFLCHQEEKNVFVNPLTPFYFYFRKTHPLPLLIHLKFDLLSSDLPIVRFFFLFASLCLPFCVVWGSGGVQPKSGKMLSDAC